MAAWLFHLRAAEMVLSGLAENPSSAPELTHWYMGNLAPDCGVPVGFAEYVPAKDITHFHGEAGTDPEKYARQYLTSEARRQYDRQQLWFLLGYYIHLCVDEFWKVHVLIPEKERYAALLARDKKAFYTLVKADWYDQEILWLGKRYEAGKLFAPLEMLMRQTEFPNRYLDFFPPDAFTLRLASLREQYVPEVILPKLPAVSREYPVLSPAEEEVLLARLSPSLCRTINHKFHTGTAV
ncbi:MAG: hypothetical protein IJ480_04800 [Clostridia bacterium]|nr:hypothetical protein [Clostridia bacterium]